MGFLGSEVFYPGGWAAFSGVFLEGVFGSLPDRGRFVGVFLGRKSLVRFSGGVPDVPKPPKMNAFPYLNTDLGDTTPKSVLKYGNFCRGSLYNRLQNPGTPP